MSLGLRSVFPKLNSQSIAVLIIWWLKSAFAAPPEFDPEFPYTYHGRIRRNEIALGGIIDALLDGVRNIFRTVTDVAMDTTASLGFGGNDGGVGGIVSGAINLAAVGVEIVTGVLSQILGGGDIFGGVIPFIG